jgi:hypothetical protein
MKKYFIGFVIVSLIWACSSSSDDTVTQDETIGDDEGFNRGALLENLADNIIIPAYQDLSSDLEALTASKNTFTDTPNQANLETLRNAWLEAYTTWQHVELFNIGEAERILYSFQMNVYPTSVEDIEKNVSSGDYNLESANNNDAVGFPALDYLLYGVAENDAAIVDVYSSENYRTYLSDLVDQMEALTSGILKDWTSSYRNTFVSQTGNTATSALNQFTNDYIFYYEKKLRANKIGIPAGKFSGTPLPNTVEGFYSRIYSKRLALEGMQSVINVFNGTGYNTNVDGVSFKTYLEELNRTDVSSTILERYDNGVIALETLSDDFVNQINSNNVAMTQALDVLQLAVVSIKVDMLSAFDIKVDFVDADGD